MVRKILTYQYSNLNYYTECPRGHPYFISEVSTNNIISYIFSSSVVGQHKNGTALNVDQKLEESNIDFKLTIEVQDSTIPYSVLLLINVFICRNDTTQTGYALGPPEQRETIPSPERSLSPAACAILRAIMHSALLWATCNNEVYHYSSLQYSYLSCYFHPLECNGRSHPAHSYSCETS